MTILRERRLRLLDLQLHAVEKRFRRLRDAEAIEIEGAAHLVPLERPEAVNALMLDRMSRWIDRKRY